jgi:transposase-like protein
MLKKRKHTAVFKTSVALAAIKGELTQSQITGRYKIHTTQITRWKKQALEWIKQGFSEQLKDSKPDKASEQLLSELYEEIGRLKVELSWLKKKSEFNF